MQIFLTHTDTPYRLYREPGVDLHVSPVSLSIYEKATILFAFWCHHGYSDEEGWHHFLNMKNLFATWQKGLPHHVQSILSIEDVRILSSAPEERMEKLYQLGIRTITPLWRGISSIGGAYDTDVGLTPLGVKICSMAQEMGIHLDISHANPKSAKEILAISRHYGIPPLASHSNFYEICPHRRNLSDELALEVANLGGVIGISFVPPHLGHGEDLEAIATHVRHGVKLGLSHHLVLGTDYDGTDTLPHGMEKGVEDLPKLYSFLVTMGFSLSFVENLFYQNAYLFF